MDANKKFHLDLTESSYKKDEKAMIPWLKDTAVEQCTGRDGYNAEHLLQPYSRFSETPNLARLSAAIRATSSEDEPGWEALVNANSLARRIVSYRKEHKEWRIAAGLGTDLTHDRWTDTWKLVAADLFAMRRMYPPEVEQPEFRAAMDVPGAEVTAGEPEDAPPDEDRSKERRIDSPIASSSRRPAGISRSKWRRMTLKWWERVPDKQSEKRKDRDLREAVEKPGCTKSADQAEARKDKEEDQEKKDEEERLERIAQLEQGRVIREMGRFAGVVGLVCFGKFVLSKIKSTG